MDFGFYLLVAGVWGCVALAAIFLRLYLVEQRKETDMANTLERIADVPKDILKAVDSVVDTGEQSKIDFTVTIFGRKIGVNIEVFLLAKDGGRQ